MRIYIIGNGAWGSTIGTLLSQNNYKFSFWRKGGRIEDGAILIMAIPTQAIREVLGKTGKVKNVTYINCAKGIEKKSHKLPYEIATEILGKHIKYFSLIGPSFAQEVKDKMPTLVNLGYTKKKGAEDIRKLFQTHYFRVRLTNGVNALELASAFKNVYAIACGAADGLGFGTNTRVKLILIAIEEFYRLSKKLGYSIDRRALPGTIGDLILTCNSEESRNFSFGKLLPKYKSEEALKKIGETVEGYYTVQSVPYFEKETGVALPLARFVYGIVGSDSPSKTRSLFLDFVKTA